MAAINGAGYGADDEGIEDEAESLNDLLLASARKMKQPLNPSTLSSPSIATYLSHLTNLPMPSLASEPETLKAASATLDADLGQLCFREYRTFILAHEASTAIEMSFGRLGGSLDGLLSATAALEKASRGFSGRVDGVLSERKQMDAVLDNLGKVEELLEVPRLVATCVRVGSWHEAVDLWMRIRELERRMKKAGQGVAVLRAVREEVDEALRDLRSQVLQGLRARELKLLTAVRSIAVLRRLHAASLQPSTDSMADIASLDEPSLRLAFLASRWEALRTQLEQLQLSSGLVSHPSGAPLPLAAFDDPGAASGTADERARFVRRWVELWRELTGEALSMYTEIFLDGRKTGLGARTPGITPITPSQKAPHSNPSKPASVALAQEEEPPTYFLTDALAPLTAFGSHSLAFLFRFLSHQLPQFTTVTSLTSLLTQLSFCAVAFGKWGFDFRGVAETLVARQTQVLVNQRMEDALEALRAEVRTGMGAVAGPRGHKRRSASYDAHGRPFVPGPETWLIASDALRSVLALPEPPRPGETPPPGVDEPPSSPRISTSNVFRPTEEPHQPHPSLTLFPPLARFLNAQLTALNELRLFASVDLFPSTLSTLLKTLNDATSILFEVSNTVTPLDPPPEGNEDGSTTDEEPSMEATLKRTRHRITVAAFLTWARLVVPLLVDGLREGVYGEIESAMEEGKEDVEALLDRCEKELARLCGEPRLADVVAEKSAATPSAQANPLPGIAE